MNVQIIAGGRTVFIADCHGGQEDCAGLALDLWQQTEPDKEDLGAGTNVHLEKDYQSTGFVDVSAGERLAVR